MIYDALRGFLLDDSRIAAIITSRAYPIKLPQNPTTPAITITPISGQRAAILEGRAPLAHPRYQIDCWVQEQPGQSAFQQARALGHLVRQRLEAYSGIMLDRSTSPATPLRTWVHFDDERESFDGDVSGGWYRHSADYFVWFDTGQL